MSTSHWTLYAAVCKTCDKPTPHVGIDPESGMCFDCLELDPPDEHGPRCYCADCSELWDQSAIGEE